MPNLFVPVDGRLTSQNELVGPITDGTALLYIVSPGNEAQGNSYKVTLTTISDFLNASITSPLTFVTSGASYNSVAADKRIMVNKTIGSATGVLLLASTSYVFPVLVKDLKGDADINPITVTFTGGQTLDGLSQIVINNPYGYFWFNPLPTGGWYDASF